MRHIRHTAPRCPWTGRAVWTLGAEGPGEASVLFCGHAHGDSALSLTGPSEGRRGGQQSCHSGLGTYTRGWDVLSSYVYYYFFPAILQEAECDTEFNETSV